MWKRGRLSYERIGELMRKNSFGRMGCRPGRGQAKTENIPVAEGVVIEVGFFRKILNFIMGVESDTTKYPAKYAEYLKSAKGGT